jgi:hypothetical protein
MKKLLTVLLCLVLTPALAQQKTKPALTTEIDTNLPDNTTGLITPAIVRSTLIDIVNSYLDLNGNASFTCGTNTWVSAQTTTASTCTQPAFSQISGAATSGQVTLTATSGSLVNNVAMTATPQYFDGPQVGQGTTGVWFASGNVTVYDTSAAASINCKLWDGTTVIDSGIFSDTAGANQSYVLHLAGFITNPAGNIKISCQDISSTHGVIAFNDSGMSKDATVTAFRIQ